MRICEAKTFRELVQEAGHLFGPKTFLENHLGPNTISYSYHQARQQIEDIAKGFIILGIQKGDRICIVATNSPEWILSYFAIVYIGAVVIPIGPDLPIKEVLNILNFTNSKAVIADQRRASALEGLLSEDPGAPILIKIDQPLEPLSVDSIRKGGASAVNIEFPPLKTNDVAAIVFTSGTTSDPKGAVLTHYNFLSNVYGARQNVPIDEFDNILCILPLYHVYPFTTSVLMPYVAGSKITLLGSYKPYRILGTMQKSRVTIAVVVPLFLKLLHDGIIEKVKARLVSRVLFNVFYFLSSKAALLGIPLGRVLFRRVHKQFGPKFRFFTSGGSKLSSQLASFFHSLGFLIIQGYGLTETSPFVSMNPLYGKNKIHSVGPVVGGVQIRIANADREGVGEILVRGPNVMREIFGDRDKTEEKIKDGWFYTGDLGYLDQDEYLFICGRKKDMIVGFGGVKIYPEDVEGCYLASPLIEELCVVGVKDINSSREHVERIEALICPDFSHPLIEPISTNKAELRKVIGAEIKRISQDLPYGRQIKHFCLTEEALPRTLTGKIKRNEVRKKYMALITDPSTGAFSLQYLAECFLTEIKKSRTGERINSLKVKVKFQNGTSGEDCERILKEVHEFISSNVRKSDLIFSLNGQGFLIVFKTKNLFVEKIIASRLRLKSKFLDPLLGTNNHNYKLEIGALRSVEGEEEELELIFKEETAKVADIAS